jgi:hypothetical protein
MAALRLMVKAADCVAKDCHDSGTNTQEYMYKRYIYDDYYEYIFKVSPTRMFDFTGASEERYLRNPETSLAT